jgi:Glycosyl transferase 4-like domain
VIAQTNPAPTALILAPFWGQPGNVGYLRAARHARWLAESGYRVIVVCARRPPEHNLPYELIVIEDPLGICGRTPTKYTDSTESQQRAAPWKRLRRYAAEMLLIPDSAVFWSARIVFSKIARREAKTASIIISSSPPESPHLASRILSKYCHTPLLIDMRDGWLDEPLKTAVITGRIRRWAEAHLEAWCLNGAARISVTSNTWQEMLQERLPSIAKKIRVITNACPIPPTPNQNAISTKAPEEPRCLVHAGQFTGSRSTQKPTDLFLPLLENLRSTNTTGVIRLYGDLTPDDRNEIEACRHSFNTIGWNIETLDPIDREDLQKELRSADGLLLLAATQGTLPTKLFEYISTGRPIFACTPKGSAVSKIAAITRQVKTPDIAPKPFYLGPMDWVTPHSLTESAIRESFLTLVNECQTKKNL